MDLKKLNPWNWFKHEEGEQRAATQVPVKREQAGDTAIQRLAEHHPVTRLHREVDRIFNETFNAFGMPWQSGGSNDSIDTSAPFLPSIDISGNEKSYEISLDVPGHSNDDLSLEVQGDRLIIRGHKEDKVESSDKQYYRVERHAGAFQRTLSLPEDASADDITAQLNDGVLHLEIPRVETPRQDVKRINIQQKDK